MRPKTLSRLGYSVENQLAQDLKEIENLDIRSWMKTENVIKRYLFDIDQASRNSQRIEQDKLGLLVSRRQLIMCPTAGRVEEGHPCMALSLEHPLKKLSGITGLMKWPRKNPLPWIRWRSFKPKKRKASHSSNSVRLPCGS